MPFWVMLSIGFIALVGVALLIWRRQATEFQAMALGARLHPGCAVMEGAFLLLIALAYFLLARTR